MFFLLASLRGQNCARCAAEPFSLHQRSALTSVALGMYLDTYIVFLDLQQQKKGKANLCFLCQLSELYLQCLFIELAFDSTGFLHVLSVHALLMNLSSSNFCRSCIIGVYRFLSILKPEVQVKYFQNILSFLRFFLVADECWKLLVLKPTFSTFGSVVATKYSSILPLPQHLSLY